MLFCLLLLVVAMLLLLPLLRGLQDSVIAKLKKIDVEGKPVRLLELLDMKDQRGVSIKAGGNFIPNPRFLSYHGDAYAYYDFGVLTKALTEAATTTDTVPSPTQYHTSGDDETGITLHYMKDGITFEQPIERGAFVDREQLRDYVIDKFEGDKTNIPIIFWLDPTVNEWEELTKSDYEVPDRSIELVVLQDSRLGKPNQERTGEDVVHRCVIFLM
eukprot:GHVU01084547.1.p1 GENE.GHVU01084547.1~~GHVU01084547.1.p1  ORF type:complete len:215 (-),score=29.13 GHVU01084547.1:33-677(-)